MSLTPARLRSIDKFAGHMRKRWPAVDTDDIRQEAVVVALERGTFDTFARLEVQRRISRTTFQVHVPMHAPVGFDFGSISSVSTSRTAGDPADRHTFTPTLFARATDAENHTVELCLAIRIERVRQALVAAEWHASRGMPSFVRECGKAATAGRYSGLYAELAERFCLPYRTIIAALGRYSRRVALDRSVVALRRELAQLEHEAKS